MIEHGKLFAAAGLWEKWKSPTGEIIESYTIITQPATEKMAHIHDRMPAILLPEQEKDWLDAALSGKEALQLIIPYPDEWIDAYTVSDRVGKVSENDMALIDEVKVKEEIQGDLFS